MLFFGSLLLNVVLTESCELRNISCLEPSLLIEGLCDSSGNLMKRPLCVEEISEKTIVMLSNQHITWLTDKNLDNCNWINQSNILSIQLTETFSSVDLTLLTPSSHKRSLKSSVWSVAISDNTDLINPIPHKDENMTADNKTYSIHWSLNETGNQIHLKLLIGSVFPCHIYVHAVPNTGNGDASKKKQAYVHSENSDYGKKEAKDTENGTKKILWAILIIICVFGILGGFFLLNRYSAFDRFKRIFEKNRRRSSRNDHSVDLEAPQSDRPTDNSDDAASIPLNPRAEESHLSIVSSNDDNSDTIQSNTSSNYCYDEETKQCNQVTSNETTPVASNQRIAHAESSSAENITKNIISKNNPRNITSDQRSNTFAGKTRDQPKEMDLRKLSSNIADFRNELRIP